MRYDSLVRHPSDDNNVSGFRIYLMFFFVFLRALRGEVLFPG